ncbi:hypothetical protein J6590_103865, partial [Homalodisca vitripennis]
EIRPPGETHYNKKRAETPTAWLKAYRGDGNVGQLRCIPVYIQLGSLPRPQPRLPPLSFQGTYTTCGELIVTVTLRLRVDALIT